MQCPKCKYEPTLAEHQASPDACSKCGIVYSKFGKAAGTAVSSSSPQRAGKSSGLLAAILAVVIAVGGWFGYGYYQNRQTYGAVETEVRLASAHVKNVLAALDGSGGMTFAEYFGKADNAVKEIDSAIVRVSILEPKNAAVDQSIGYMKKGQEVVRSAAGVMRATLQFSTAANQAEAASSGMDSDNEYIRDAAYSRKLKALNEQKEALESISAARQSFLGAVAALNALGQEIEGISPTALIDQELYRSLEESKK